MNENEYIKYSSKKYWAMLKKNRRNKIIKEEKSRK